MIICGLPGFGAKPHRSFLEILSSGIDLFPKSSAHDSLFFENVQQLSRRFSGILST
jgi:hypothetical protein